MLRDLLMKYACARHIFELYRMLNEDDEHYGLWKKGEITTKTREGTTNYHARHMYNVSKEST